MTKSAAQQAREEEDEAQAKAEAKQDKADAKQEKADAESAESGKHAYPLAMYKLQDGKQLEEKALTLEEEKALLAKGYLNGHDFFTRHNKKLEAESAKK